MEIKKYPKVDLSKYSLIFFQIGMVAVLFFTWRALEWKRTDSAYLQIEKVNVSDDLEDFIPITKPLDVPPPPPPPPPAVSSTVIQTIEDDSKMDETIIKSMEIDQDDEILEVREIPEKAIEEEEEIAPVPFAVIENVPIYPGCEAVGDNEAKKKCMSAKIDEFIRKKFNTELANDLGLEGKQRIFVSFKISKLGDVTNVSARAPHAKLEQEAMSIIKSLPQMTPGKQRGVPVEVMYSLPIMFQVQN